MGNSPDTGGGGVNLTAYAVCMKELDDMIMQLH
jgi:hypothetical protein